jgi:hypothetical protein
VLIHITSSLKPLISQLLDDQKLHQSEENGTFLKQFAEELSGDWQWNAHSFSYLGSHCILICHNATGFILVLPVAYGDELHHFKDIVRDLLIGSIEDLGYSSSEARKLALKVGMVRFDDSHGELEANRDSKEMISVAWQDLNNLVEERPNLLLWNPLRLIELINERLIKLYGVWCTPQELFKAFIDKELSK